MNKIMALLKFSGRTQHYSRRQAFIRNLFFLLMIIFAYRSIAIHQLSAGDISIQQKATEQANSFSSISSWRGDILDRKGVVIASNLILKKVNLDSTQIQKSLIPELAKVLMMPEKKLQAAVKKKLSKRLGRKNLIIKKNLKLTSPILKNLKKLEKTYFKVCRTKKKKDKASWFDKALIFVKLKTNKPTYNIAKICKKETIRGVRLQEDTRRYYPKSASLSPLIGRINYSKKGISGIEREFESVLAGQNGAMYLSFNQDSKGSYYNSVMRKTRKNGQDIQLTIDADIQFHAYTAIKKSVKKHRANSGSAIILKPNGEILAMVNYPADDPNNKAIYNAKNYRNRVLADNLDPGSTIKPFTMLLALDKKKITANDDELIDVTKRIGHLKPNGKYKQMTIKKILQKSHNLGTVKVSERLKKKELYDTWRKLGFGQPLGLISGVESFGLLRHFSTWALSDKHSLSFGYGPMQTNLAQLAKAYLVFANNGAVPDLKLVNGVNAQRQTQATQVFSEAATHKIADLLSTVASKKGSGYRAQIKGYNVAGKTGTAEMVVNGRYSKKGAKRTFFAGFVPVKKPKYIMVVRLDHPKRCYTHYSPKKRISCEGSNSAAMVFKEAMERILNNDQSINFLVSN